MQRFDVQQVQINVAAAQHFTIDAHLTTRKDRLSNVVTVAVGNLLVYCCDLNAVRGFATACRSACGFLPAGFPRSSGPEADLDERSAVGIVLWVEGSPRKSVVNGLGAAFGTPHVRVEIDRLVVRFFDLDSLTSWKKGWADAERLALRVWPDPDAFEQAEARARRRIAKTGRDITSQTVE